MRTRWLWIALLLSLGLNLGLGLNLWRRGGDLPPPPDRPADAPEVWGGPPPDTEQLAGLLRHRLDRLTRRLDLTAAQRDSLWALHQAAGPEVFARRRALAAAREQMHALLEQPTPDPRALQAARRQASAIQAELDSLVISLMLRERAVLTPEQAARYRGLFPFGGPERPRHGRGEPGQRGGRRQAP